MQSIHFHYTPFFADPVVKEACANSSCEHGCLVESRSPACFCPTGFQVFGDRCEGESECNTHLDYIES